MVSWIVLKFRKLHHRLRCNCMVTSSEQSSLFNTWSVDVFSVIFVFLYVAVQVECFVDLIKFAIVLGVTIWMQVRQVTDYVRVLRLSPLLAREQCKSLLHIVTKRAKRSTIVFLPPFRNLKRELYKSRRCLEEKTHVDFRLCFTCLPLKRFVSSLIINYE
jgi:hypothetical protein